MTTKKAFVKRAMELCPSAEMWRMYIDKAISAGCLKSFDDMEDNYRDVYPLAVAILEREVAWCLNTTDEKTRRACRREANNIKCFL